MELLSLRWTDFYNYSDPNYRLEKIMELWLRVKDKHAPLKTKIYGSSTKEQNFSKECCQLMKGSDRAKKVAKISQEDRTGAITEDSGIESIIW